MTPHQWLHRAMGFLALYRHGYCAHYGARWFSSQTYKLTPHQ
jgi:hypothetical protein